MLHLAFICILSQQKCKMKVSFSETDHFEHSIISIPSLCYRVFNIIVEIAIIVNLVNEALLSIGNSICINTKITPGMMPKHCRYRLCLYSDCINPVTSRTHDLSLLEKRIKSPKHPDKMSSFFSIHLLHLFSLTRQ